jgi:RimJ/RimL family protein N-acetyltransferase
VTVPVLSDGVVTLRAHHDDDVARIVEQCLDPVSVEWTTVPLGYTRDDATTFVRHVMPGGWASDQEWGFAVEYGARFGGTVSLRNRAPHLAEVAYGAHPDVRGTGAMERALRLLLGWGFEERGLQTVIWYANAGNVASRRLAQRVGFSFDGTLRGFLDHRGTPTDAWVGTLLRGELQAGS